MLVEHESDSGPDISVPTEVDSQEQAEGLFSTTVEDYPQVVIADAGLDVIYNGLASQISEHRKDKDIYDETAQKASGIVALHLVAGLVAVASTVAIFGRGQDSRYKGLTEHGRKIQQEIDDWNRSGQGRRPTAHQRRMIEQEVTGPMEDELSRLKTEIGRLQKSAKRSKNPRKKANAQKGLAAKQHKADKLERKIKKKKSFFKW